MGGVDPRTVTILAVLLLAPAGAALSTPALHDQDDAGSGGDAPDRFEDGLRIEPGSFEGTLFDVDDGRFAKPVLDEADWYRFWAEQGELIEIDARASDTPRGATIFELRRALDGGIANYTISSGDTVSTTVVTDRSGWWALGVRSSGDGEIDYSVSLSIVDPRETALAQAGTGWIATGVEVAPGGSATMYVWQPHRSFPENNEYLTALVEGGDRLLAGLTATSNAHRLGAQAGDLELHATTKVGPGWMYARAVKAVINEPGTYHLVHMAQADDLYMSTWLENTDDATALGSTAGRELIAADASDFDGTAAVDAGWVHASLDVRKRVDVGHTLVGMYTCGEAVTDTSRCSITSPSGQVRSFGANYTTDLFVGAEPGVWTFERDRSVDVYPDRRLFVADVALPGLEPGGRRAK